MPIRGRLVCHSWCPLYVVPVGPHHENFGRNLYHMFVSGLFCEPILCFVLSCGIRVASMSSVDSIPYPKPVWAPPQKLRTKSLSYVCFWLILQAKFFVLFYLWYSSWIHTFHKRCSHISMVVLILLDHWGCHVNSFPTGVPLFKWIRSFQHSQDQFSVLCNGVCFFRPKLSLFSPPSHPFSSRTQISYSSILLLMVSLSIPFPVNVLIRWFSWRF